MVLRDKMKGWMPLSHASSSGEAILSCVAGTCGLWHLLPTGEAKRCADLLCMSQSLIFLTLWAPLTDISWIVITNSYVVSCEVPCVVPCVEWANIYLPLTMCQAFFTALYLTSSSQHLSYPRHTGKARIHTQVFGLFKPLFCLSIFLMCSFAKFIFPHRTASF